MRATFGGEVVREVCAWAAEHPEAARDLAAALADRSRGPLSSISEIQGRHPEAAKSFVRGCAQTARLLMAGMMAVPRRRGRGAA